MTTCVYTAVFGGYDGLLDQPVASESASDFVCFTDDPGLTSDSWEVRIVDAAFPADSVRSARLVKILGHDSLAGCDTTLWIDASVVLRQTPEAIVSDWLTGGAEMALAAHSYRAQLVDEFDEVIRLNYDDRARVYEQLTDYALSHPDVLSEKPLWTGMLARRNTPAVRAAMRDWANHVLRYSRRDQLSVLTALTSGELAYRVLDLDNFDAPTHRWPVIPERRVAMGKAAPLPAGPFVADLRRSHVRIAELERELAETSSRAGRIDELLAERDRLVGEVEDAIRQRDAAIGERDAAIGERDAVDATLRAQSGVRGAARHLGGSVRAALLRGVKR
ncbi:glycosyltransferase domain-containing protein [Microbacterium sp. BK668]|uniref:glycosyltransferase domain-containing protein n=1 Tax=Microbacterium sp. BK668 TaxID=2512118 RepID=UPI00105E0A0F|nr:glycosyltransferase domain-containing protein [Microbacterium sp. BK668]TDN88394.1 uncharacterized protein DUF616 [Microbacterium sp. BK668]